MYQFQPYRIYDVMYVTEVSGIYGNTQLSDYLTGIPRLFYLGIGDLTSPVPCDIVYAGYCCIIEEITILYSKDQSIT